LDIANKPLLEFLMTLALLLGPYQPLVLPLALIPLIFTSTTHYFPNYPLVLVMWFPLASLLYPDTLRLLLLSLSVPAVLYALFMTKTNDDATT
jgi:hypothetical protein